MLSKRLIPTLLLKGKRLVKGTCFSDYIDVGDPLSQVKIFNAQGADEIVICDISATKEKRVMDIDLIKRMTRHSHTPLAIGGGINDVAKAHQYFEAGADKIVINTGALDDLSLIKDIARCFGSQSVVVSIDVKNRPDGGYIAYSQGNALNYDIDLTEYIQRVISQGCGEIILTSVMRDGTLKGYDLELYKQYSSQISVPLIASGGAGCYDDIVNVLRVNDGLIDGVGIGKMLFLRDYDIVRIKAYLKGKGICVREA